MNIVLITAGGCGSRMNTKTTPKQFLDLHGKPILVYTIEKFQNCNSIDAIVVVCINSWIERCKEIVTKYGLTKVCSIICGGETGQESIYNGLLDIERKFPGDSIVLIHDAVRPIIQSSTISDAIFCAKKNRSAITVSSAKESIAVINKEGIIECMVPRNTVVLARAPQCFVLSDLLKAHRKAVSENKTSCFIDSASLMMNYGHRLYTITGEDNNIKITNQSDYLLFKSLEDEKENAQFIWDY